MNTTLKNIIKWSVIGGLFAVPFIPFIVSKSLLFPFITGKAFTFRILVEVIGALWLFLALADVEYRPRWNTITKSILVFVAIVFLADILGKYSFKSLWSNYERMEGFVMVAHLALYYFIIHSMFKVKGEAEIWWKRFWNTELVASVGIALYSFLQLIHKIPVDQGSARIDATFGNASYLAIYTVFNIFIGFMLLVKDKRKAWKYGYGVVIALQLITLYYTATRGAILGLIGGVILTSIIILVQKSTKDHTKNLSRRIAGAILVATVLGILLFVSIRNTSFVKNSPVLARFTNFSLSSQENQGRSYVWPMAIKGIAERPVLGWGQEGFNYVFNKNYNPAAYNQEQWFDRTHDIFLDWLINAGVLGLLSYISLFVALGYVLFKQNHFSIEEKALLVGLMAAYVFHNIFVFDNQTSYILFFSVLAWVSSIEMPGKENVKESANKSIAVREVSTETLNYLIAPVLAIALVLCLYFVNVRPIVASEDLIQAIGNQSVGPQGNLDYFKKVFAENSFGSSEALEQLVSVTVQVIQSQSAQVTDVVKQGFFTLTDQQIKLQIARTPQDARYLLLAGSFYNRVGQYDEAIKYLNDAVKYSPNKPAMYFEIATSYLGKNNPDKAFELFTTGYNLSPNAPDSQVVYAVGAIYAKKGSVVLDMFKKIGEDKVLNDDRILSAYINNKDYLSAENILSTRLAKNPTNYTTELQLASVYATAGQKTQAIALIRDIEAKNPNSKAQLDPYIIQLSK